MCKFSNGVICIETEELVHCDGNNPECNNYEEVMKPYKEEDSV